MMTFSAARNLISVVPAVPEPALQRVSAGVLALDDEFRITYLNNAMASVLQDVNGDVRGNRYWDHVSPAVAEELRPALERAMDALSELDDERTE